MTRSVFTAESDRERLDVFLSEKLGVTRSAAKKLIDGGAVTVGGKPAKAGRPVKAGETVGADVPEPKKLDLAPEDIPVGIVYEDEDIAVIDKPQGLTVHAGNGHLSGTLVTSSAATP